LSSAVIGVVTAAAALTIAVLKVYSTSALMLLEGSCALAAEASLLVVIEVVVVLEVAKAVIKALVNI